MENMTSQNKPWNLIFLQKDLDKEEAVSFMSEDEREIVVTPQSDPDQTARILAHELAHTKTYTKYKSSTQAEEEAATDLYAMAKGWRVLPEEAVTNLQENLPMSRNQAKKLLLQMAYSLQAKHLITFKESQQIRSDIVNLD